MRLAVMLLSAGLVGYAMGRVGSEPPPSRAPRIGGAETVDGRPSVFSERDVGVHVAFSDAAWRNVVEEMPCPPPLEGDGRIRGFVRDRDGQPLAGVAVTAVPQEFPDSAADLASGARRFVARRLWQAASRLRAVSDSRGFYEIDGVGEALYALEPALDGYSFRGWRWNVHPGARAHFHGSRVVRLRFRVLLPDGSAAPFARLHLLQPGTRLGGFWSPEEDTREVEPGTWVFKAAHPVLESLASPPVEVDVRWRETPAPIVLHLRERPGIRGLVRLASGAIPQAARIYLLPCRGSDAPQAAEFEGAGMNGGLEVRLDAEDGSFGFYDIDQGSYWVAAAVQEGDVEGTTLVRVGEGIAEISLELSGGRSPSPLAALDDVSDLGG